MREIQRIYMYMCVCERERESESEAARTSGKKHELYIDENVHLFQEFQTQLLQ